MSVVGNIKKSPLIVIVSNNIYILKLFMSVLNSFTFSRSETELRALMLSYNLEVLWKVSQVDPARVSRFFSGHRKGE